jgi:mannose-1-phosphate guanylyltransferase / mannose-6-phosphate isomerase
MTEPTKTKMSIVPAVLSGGAGSRLWPISTSAQPKQFHALVTEQSMFSETLARFQHAEDIDFEPPVVICGKGHLASVQKELTALGITKAKIILEPCARNTAPALAALALEVAQSDPDQLILVLPADHVIAVPSALHDACVRAAPAARTGRIVTFAIKPDRPETGYGYIKQGQEIGENVYRVEAFVEKPSFEVATAYLGSGEYAWNAGIFFFTARAFLDELARHAPTILVQVKLALEQSQRQGGVVLLGEDAFARSPSQSVDYAIMEPTDKAAVAKVDMGWSDVGSYATLWELAQKDGKGNAVSGAAKVFEGSNCWVYTAGVPIAVIGVDDLIVVATETGVLVTRRDRAQDVRLASDAFKT